MCIQTKLIFSSCINSRRRTSVSNCIRDYSSVSFSIGVRGCKKLPYFLFLLYPGLICWIIIR